MYQKALESPGLISLVKPMKMFHPLTIFSADKNWSIAFPDRCGELANKNAMNCHQHSSRQPLFAIFASFWKSRENLVNKANHWPIVYGRTSLRGVIPSAPTAYFTQLAANSPETVLMHKRRWI